MFLALSSAPLVLGQTLDVQKSMESADNQEENKTVQLKRLPKIKVTPSEEYGHIAIQGLDQNSEFVEITIRNTNGRKMFRKKIKIENESINIDVSNLFTGNYMMEITHDQTMTQTHLVIQE